MKVLITGADGVLGNNLVRALLSRDYEVSVLLMSEKARAIGLDKLNITKIYGDILNFDLVCTAVKGQDIVIHAAASTQVYPARSKSTYDVNLTGTENVIKACLQYDVKRLIHVGTANSFAPGTIANPGTENGQYHGMKYGLDYMDSKYMAQQAVLKAVHVQGLKAIVVNPTFMIGAYDTKPSSGALILALYNKKVPVCSKGSKTYIAVSDAAAAIANAITMGKIGECYILGNHSYSYKEAFELICDVIDVEPPQYIMPSLMVKSYGAMNSFLAQVLKNPNPKVTKELAQLSCEDHCYSGEKARRELLMPCTDLRVAVAEGFNWFKENGFIIESSYVER
jgi:dihydroflavonol-4-reductase